MYCNGNYYYYEASKQSLYQKAPDSSEPVELLIGYPLRTNPGVSIRVAFLGRALALNKYFKPVTIHKLDDPLNQKVELETSERFEVFGQEMDKIILIKNHTHLIVYTVNWDDLSNTKYFQRDGFERRDEILESATVFKVCPRSKYVVVFTKSKMLSLCRVILFSYSEEPHRREENRFEVVGILDYYDLGYGLITAAEFVGYLVEDGEERLYIAGLTHHEPQSRLMIFCFDSKEGKFYEIKEHARTLKLYHPDKMVRLGDWLYASDHLGAFVKIRLGLGVREAEE